MNTKQIAELTSVIYSDANNENCEYLEVTN